MIVVRNNYLPKIINLTIIQAIIIESLCAQCFKDGETRMLLTDIPFFRSVVIISFECPHCGFKNNELQDTNSLAEYGEKITLTINDAEDLRRSIVRGKWASTLVPQLGMEIPATQKGFHSTLEGYLTSFKDDLLLGQEDRKEKHPEDAKQIEDFVEKLDKYINVDPSILPFEFVLDDPSGLSYVQNFKAPKADPQIKSEKYVRTREQIISMGYNPENVIEEVDTRTKEEIDQTTRDKFEALKTIHFSKNPTPATASAKYSEEETNKLFEKLQSESKKFNAHKTDFTKPLEQTDVDDQILEFDVECHVCFNMGKNRMCTCTIPYFKEIIIMAFTCGACGARSTEVKVGGGISEKATKYTITVNSDDEINRDLFKSETAAIHIPEIGLEVVSGSLGGVYSTVEGLLEKMLGTLRDDNPFVGDSADLSETSKFGQFLIKLQDLKDGNSYPFTMILDDPMSNCFIQNPSYPEEDPQVSVEIYERTFEQNEELGINDMQV